MNKKGLLPRIGRVSTTCILSCALISTTALPAVAESSSSSQSNTSSNSDTIDNLRQEEDAARSAAEDAQRRAEDAKNQQSALEQEVQQAQQRLEQLYMEAEICENEYIAITNQLEQTEQSIVELDEQIEQTKAELEKAKTELADIVSDTYKNGRPTLLSVALSATSFDDLLSRIHSANKVADYETSVVENVKALEAKLEQERQQLEEKKAQEEEQQAEKEERLAAAEAAVDAAENYKAQLSAEIQQKIAEADLAMRQAAEETARADAAQAQRIAEEEALRKAEEEARRKAAEEALKNAGAGSGAPAATVDVQTFVANAYSIIGSAYSYSGYYWTGSTADSWFTCSGVVDYALGRGSRASWPESLYDEVGSRMVYDISQLNYGDLVFYACLNRSPGHVAIYIGDGKIIDSVPNGGVAIRDVDYMTPMGGGPIL